MMARWRRTLIETLRTSLERKETSAAQPAIDQRQVELAREVVGAWVSRPLARVKDRVFDFFRSHDERQKAADVRALLEANPQHADRRIEEALRRYDKIIDSGRTVDVSETAREIRARMGWPPTGSVRGLTGGSPELCGAVEAIEASNGQMPIAQAVSVLAVLDPQGVEAAYVEWRRNQGRPLP